MRKIISTILVLTMVLSLFSFSVSAEHWADAAIDFVTENGYWISSQPLEPDKAATRAETASLFARILISKIPEYNGAFVDVARDNIYGGDITAVSLMGLMKGYEGEFRPDDTLTREELACILDRAAKMVSNNFADTEYNMEFYKDGEQVSDWALQSVENVSAYVLMKGLQGKAFAPKGTTTLAEVATVVKALADTADLEKADTVTSTARDIGSADNIQEDFDVIQSGGLWVESGWAGFGMIARFDGTPGDIYVARKHPNTATRNGYNEDPVSIVRVVDPNGNVVARENMYWKDQGTMEKIINIPNGEPGIYRIQFAGGNKGDTCTIGVKNPVSWGVYGETSFRFTETTPKTSYFWVPWKVSTVHIGLAAGEGSVYTDDGENRVAALTGSKAVGSPSRVSLNTLEADSVYMLKVDDNFTGLYALLGGSPVLCPTAEMARDLKGGYIWYEDEYGAFQFHGPLQVRARKRMIEIYEEMGGDFDVVADVPTVRESPDAYDNVIAEAQFYAAYYGSIAWLKPTMMRQILDPSSPWMGAFASNQKEVDDPSTITSDWQTQSYSNARLGPNYMVGALTINGETNTYYANPVLQKRVELEYLAWVMQMTHSGSYYYAAPNTSSTLNNYYHQYENFSFGEQGMPFGYNNAQEYLSPQTRAITDEGIIQMSEVVMHTTGQGATNQSLMCIEGSLCAYFLSGKMQHFLDHFEMSAIGAAYPSTQPGYMGQMEIGYWLEGQGSDGGSYGRMCEGMWDNMVMDYLTMPKSEQDPEIAAQLRATTERFLIWDSLWYAPSINGFPSIRPASWTGRVNEPYGGNSAIIGNAYLINVFPRAKRADQVSVLGVKHVKDYPTPTSASTVGSLAKTEMQAYNHLKDVLTPKKYDNCYNVGKEFSYKAEDSTAMWKALHEPQQYEDSELPKLPFELPGDYNVYDPPGGVLALKHKGIYMTFFYDNGGRKSKLMSGYQWYTGGPMQVWDEYFGMVMSCQKPAQYTLMNIQGGANMDANDYRNHFSENEMVHTAIMGKEKGGGLFIEGRMYGDIEWFDDKSFEIRSEQGYYARDTVWQYKMTDEGYEITVGMDEISDREDLWVQFAVLNPGVAVGSAHLIHTDSSLTWEHEGKTLTMSWDASVESRMRDKVNSKSSENYKYLQLKLTPDMPMVKIKITRDVGDYVFNSGYETNFE